MLILSSDICGQSNNSAFENCNIILNDIARVLQKGKAGY